MTFQHFHDFMKTHKGDLSLTEAAVLYNEAQTSVNAQTTAIFGSFTYTGGLVTGQRYYPFHDNLLNVKTVYVDGEEIGKVLTDLVPLDGSV